MPNLNRRVDIIPQNPYNFVGVWQYSLTFGAIGASVFVRGSDGSDTVVVNASAFLAQPLNGMSFYMRDNDIRNNDRNSELEFAFQQPPVSAELVIADSGVRVAHLILNGVTERATEERGFEDRNFIRFSGFQVSDNIPDYAFSPFTTIEFVYKRQAPSSVFDAWNAFAGELRTVLDDAVVNLVSGATERQRTATLQMRYDQRLTPGDTLLLDSDAFRRYVVSDIRHSDRERLMTVTATTGS